MGKPDARLSDASRNGVYRVAAAADAFARASALPLARVSLRAAADKASMLEAVSRQLAFPEWFGGNWDALEDCLCDLSWRGAAAHLLLFEEHARPLDACPDELGLLIDVLRVAADHWRGRGVPFFALFADPGAKLNLPPLPDARRT